MIVEDAHTHTPAHARVEGYTLTVEDVATQIGKSVETVRRYIRTGKLAALRIEGKNTNEYRINPDDLAALDAHTQSGTHTPARAGDRAPTDEPVTAPAEAIQALMQAITAQLDAQYQARLADKDALIGELRRRAEVAEHEIMQRRSARRRLPWWLRVFLG